MTTDTPDALGHKAVKGRVFPIPFAWTCLFVVLAYFVGSAVYYSVSKRIYGSYLDSVKNATVVCRVLSAYGRSGKFGCALSDKAMAIFVRSKQTDDAEGRRLTPPDLLLLLAEADVADMDNFENPDDILDLAAGGPTAWIASKLIGTTVGERTPLDEVFLTGSLNNTTNGNCVQTVGTLTALQLLYSAIRTADTGGDRSEPSSCLPGSVSQGATKMAELLVGESPQFFDIGIGKKPDDSYLVIKGAMTYPWRLYDAGRIDLVAQLPPIPDSYAVVRTEGELYGRKTDAKLNPGNISWVHTPEVLNDAVFKFSHLLVKEILRDPSVKSYRFAYQAFRGWIQQLLICLSVYIFLVLVWRLAAAITKRKYESGTPLWPPLVIKGSLPSQKAIKHKRVHEELEGKVRQSRAFTDLLINTLPLIGLFGTVVGILLGLPNASAAVTSTGPLAGSAINALFEQLGLAFSTTALAVLALIMFQMAWALVQFYENRALDGKSELEDLEKAPHTEEAGLAHVKSLLQVNGGRVKAMRDG